MANEQTPFDRQVSATRQRAPGPTRAPHTILLQPADFAYDYSSKPTTPIVVGLREVSVADAERAIGFSKEKSSPDERRIEQMIFIAARGLCDPNDIEKPHPNFECAEDLIRIALTETTIERILAEMSDQKVRSGFLDSEADDDEVHQLGMMLCVDDPFQHIAPSHVAMARRHIRYALNELLDGLEESPD
jgi:hypothetical protein